MPQNSCEAGNNLPYQVLLKNVNKNVKINLDPVRQAFAVQPVTGMIYLIILALSEMNK